MNSAKLSFILGCYTSTLGGFLIPLSLILYSSPIGVAPLTFGFFTTTCFAFVGTISALMHIGTSDGLSDEPTTKRDHTLAIRGLLLSIIPVAFWSILIFVSLSK
jgi:hypothetical protein